MDAGIGALGQIAEPLHAAVERLAADARDARHEREGDQAQGAPLLLLFDRELGEPLELDPVGGGEREK